MKKYLKASEILPEKLLNEIQQYIEGETLYIPRRTKGRVPWGERTGIRSELKQRNEIIRRDFKNGATLESLAQDYCLALETIKKIVYHKE